MAYVTVSAAHHWTAPLTMTTREPPARQVMSRELAKLNRSPEESAHLCAEEDLESDQPTEKRQHCLHARRCVIGIAILVGLVVFIGLRISNSHSGMVPARSSARRETQQLPSKEESPCAIVNRTDVYDTKVDDTKEGDNKACAPYQGLFHEPSKSCCAASCGKYCGAVNCQLGNAHWSPRSNGCCVHLFTKSCDDDSKAPCWLARRFVGIVLLRAVSELHIAQARSSSTLLAVRGALSLLLGVPTSDINTTFLGMSRRLTFQQYSGLNSPQLSMYVQYEIKFHDSSPLSPSAIALAARGFPPILEETFAVDNTFNPFDNVTLVEPVEVPVGDLSIVSHVASAASGKVPEGGEEVALIPSVGAALPPLLAHSEASSKNASTPAACQSAIQQYYLLRKQCMEEQDKMKASCDEIRDNAPLKRACDNDYSVWYDTCRRRAYPCYREMRNSGECGHSIEVCKPQVGEFPCSYKAEKAYRLLESSCKEQYETRKAECPNSTYRPRCMGVASSLFNECISSQSQCRERMIALDCVAVLPECNPHLFSPKTPLGKGKDVELEDGIYTIRSVTGCEWGGRFCNAPLWITRESDSAKPFCEVDRVPKLQRRDDMASKLKLEKVGNGSYFYIYDHCGRPLSYDADSECPETQWNKHFKDCYRIIVGTSANKTLFKISLHEGADGGNDFVISIPSSHNATGGWQLSSNEESCGKHLPVLTVERLSFQNTWRIEKIVDTDVDCVWSDWNFGKCNAQCGEEGVREDARVKQVMQQNDGKKCEGEAVRKKFCKGSACVAVDCEWSQWSKWGSCSKSCGIGTQKRQRKKVTEEAHGGVCSGTDVESTACDEGACPQTNSTTIDKCPDADCADSSVYACKSYVKYYTCSQSWVWLYCKRSCCSC